VTFKSTKYEANGEGATLYGDLTIQGHTKNIAVNVEPGGIVVDPYGQTKAGFTVNGKISRKEFGLTWNAVTEAGGVVVGDDIKFNGEIQLIKQS
jgi:polyisoprenoid-binding protein YceI